MNEDKGQHQQHMDQFDQTAQMLKESADRIRTIAAAGGKP